MVVKKPRIVIIGAGMAGLVAANKLYTSPGTKEAFELCIVEGGNRIGGRILTSEIGGDRIEMGATWIHGVGGSPIFKIAEEIGALDSKQPWEHKDGYPKDVLTVAEGGLVLDSVSIVEPISNLYRNLMDYAQGKLVEGTETYKKNSSISNGYSDKLSIGSFLRKGLEAYWNSAKSGDKMIKSLEEAVFAMHENEERAHTSAGELSDLDYNAESEYKNFPDEELTIAKGYLRVVESLASVFPSGLIQLGRKVIKIEWKKDENEAAMEMENRYGSSRPVKLHFDDGSVMVADHVIVTVSLGVLKAGIRDGSPSGMCFSPPLPSFKKDAISRLGFGTVNKLFLELSPTYKEFKNFPNLQMAFHSSSSELRKQEIPRWMRRTASLSPIYNDSSVLLSWFAGKEALELESLEDEEIINGITTTISSFLPEPKTRKVLNSQQCSNGNALTIEFARVVKSKWGTDPLFMGSYSYVAVGSSGKDLDSMAEPLPCVPSTPSHPLQILFAGEATHRTHYSTTHGAYFSGEREANRILKYYNL
ncbi:probable polyamine oxidase 5 [Papaver somniferum]|uniref:probable polyamine oxidase 5 n=1 Tax=Papaver somniferum TaxID=3469 RepID=UPI000E6F9CEA|nr:probable polyamine oxidase 5 [Papaver somniferum]